MADSRTHLFCHEARTALKENRFLLPLAPLVTLVALAAYHGWIPIQFDGPSGYLANLLKTIWPAIAWIPPCLMLKRPDLRDRDAAWRTLPVSKQVVFGSRLLVVGVFTVVIPALMVGLASLVAKDGMAWEQGLRMFAYQWAYLWLGALAAYAMRGYRGLALIPGMAVAVVLSALTCWCFKSFDTRFTESISSHDHTQAYGLLLPWLLIAVGGPVAVTLLIRKSNAKSYPWRWIAGAFLACPVVMMLQSFIGNCGERFMLPYAKLPTIETDLLCSPAGNDFLGFARRANISLPAGFSAYRTDECGGYESTFASGYWKSHFESGFFSQRSSGNSASLRGIFASEDYGFTVLTRGFLSNPYQSCSLRNWLSFGTALGLTHPTVQGITPLTHPTAQGTTTEPLFQWVPVPTKPSRVLLTLDFFTPRHPTTTKEWFAAKAGETVSVNAGIPVHEAMPPKVIFKATLKTLHAGGGNHAEMPKNFVLKTFEKNDNGWVFLTFRKRLNLGPVGAAFVKHRAEPFGYGVNLVALMLNRRLEQVVFLEGSSTYREMSGLPAEDITLNLTIPKPSPFLNMTQAWLDEAELIVLESENGPAVTLPLKLSFKIPESPVK